MGSWLSGVVLAVLVCGSPWAYAAAACSPPPPNSPAALPAAAAAKNLPPTSDAAKHAKRTQCLKEARARKIVGARRTTFVHSCLALP